MKQKTIFILAILIIGISFLLTSCSQSSGALGKHEEMLFISISEETDDFIFNNEANFSNYTFEYIDSSGKIINLTWSDLEISTQDSSKLKIIGYHTIKVWYNSAECHLSFLVREETSEPIFTLTFDSNEGTFRDGKKLKAFDTTSIFNQTVDFPTRTGFLFSGWFPNKMFISEDKLVIPFRVTDDMTFFAKWTSDKTYTVEYKKAMYNEDTKEYDISSIPAISKIELAEGEKFYPIDEDAMRIYNVLPTAEDYTKYDFIGYIEEGKDNEYIDSTEPITISANLVIELRFKIKKFTVSFLDTDGNKFVDSSGNAIEGFIFPKKYGDDILPNLIPAPPYEEGSRTWWFNDTKNANFSNTDVTNITRDIKISLRKEVITVSINFYSEQGQILPGLSGTYNYGDFIGSNKSVPNKDGYEGKWKAPFKDANDNDVYFTVSDLRTLEAKKDTFESLEEIKEISFYATYFIKNYTLIFNYNLPGIEGLKKNKSIIYNSKIDVDIFMNPFLYAPSYIINNSKYSGYDKEVFHNSKWHYKQNYTRTTEVEAADYFNSSNPKLESFNWSDNAEYNFYFEPTLTFDKSLIGFSSILNGEVEYTDVTNLINYHVETNENTAFVIISDYSKLMALYPSKTLEAWEITELNYNQDPIQPQLYVNSYTYYEGDFVYYSSAEEEVKQLYRALAETKGNDPTNVQFWEKCESIEEKPKTLGLNNFSLNEKHYFDSNLPFNLSVRPVFEDRIFTINIYNQIFDEPPIPENNEYVYSYRFESAIPTIDNLSYEQGEIYLRDYFNSIVKPTYPQNEDNFVFSGFFLDPNFSSELIELESEIIIYDDYNFYPKWIDYNYGSEGLVFTSSDTESSIDQIRLDIKNQNSTFDISIIIPELWDNKPVTNINPLAFKILNQYPNVSVNILELPKTIITINSDIFKYFKNLHTIKINNDGNETENKNLFVRDGILFQTEEGITSIVKVPTHFEIENLIALIIDENVEKISNFAFAFNQFDYNLDLSATSITNIGDYAFFSNIQMTSITLNPNTTYIGEYAFFACKNLANILVSGTGFSQSVESIKISNEAFGQTYWLNNQIDNTEIKLSNVLVKYLIKSNQTNIVLDKTITHIASEAFMFDISDGGEFDQIKIIFSSDSEISFIASGAFLNTSGIILEYLREDEIGDLQIEAGSFDNVKEIWVISSEMENVFNSICEAYNYTDIEINMIQ